MKNVWVEDQIDNVVDEFQLFLERNDEWRGSSKTLAGVLREFLETKEQ